MDLLAEMIDVTSCELFSVQEDVAACLTRAEELERRQEDQEEEYLCFQVSARGKYSYPPPGGKYTGLLLLRERVWDKRGIRKIMDEIGKKKGK